MSTNVEMRSMNGTQTLSRALDILFALAEADGTLTVSDIAQKVSIPESSTYRFLQTLEQNGIVERRGKGQIGLGMRILDLARSLSEQVHRELVPLALPVMEELTKETNETSLLFIRSGTNAISIQTIRSKALIQYSAENGRILPLYLGASGKAILAYESEKIVHNVLDKWSPDLSKDLLLSELSSIREQGYALTQGEIDPDVFAVGAPVFDSRGALVASLSIAGPKYRFDDVLRQLSIDAVQHAAEQVSRKLGKE
ncbi:IclR family transcriptional regulator [Paenibacillus sinopodophylli]|uniref:IclR family transcriptional regulator n=1 Tax=Paenibacillus sinopodophylli TaxID=1837342 RepID=UPI001FEA94DC|nr:IclR family transcriptional regulator [Paenibacillus sinopodophylli]